MNPPSHSIYGSAPFPPSMPPPSAPPRDMSEKLDFLHRDCSEMANLKMECDRLINRHEIVKQSLNQTGTAFDTPSSAYNTGGESCRSATPEGLNCIECSSCLVDSLHPSRLPSPFKLASPRQHKKRYVELTPMTMTSPQPASHGWMPADWDPYGRIGFGADDGVIYGSNALQLTLPRQHHSGMLLQRRSQPPMPAAAAAAAGPSCAPSSPQPLRRSSHLEMQQVASAAARQPQLRLHRSRGLPLAAPDLIYRNSSVMSSRGDTPRPSPSREGAKPSSEASALAERLRLSEAALSAPSPSFRLRPPVAAAAAAPAAAPAAALLPPPAVKKKRSYSLIKLLSRSTGEKKSSGDAALFMFGQPLNDFVLNCERSEDDVTITKDVSTLTPPTVVGSSGGRPNAGDVQYKWKVKRRSDGSRYIVKRPIRSQVLKKREAQLLRERPGITTDEDTLSTTKLGQFLPRDDRKKVLGREKEKKRRRQQKLIEAAESAAVQQPIISLSQLKQHRKQADLLMDDFATTQEWLSQRNRLESPSATRRQSTGIPTVTTV